MNGTSKKDSKTDTPFPDHNVPALVMRGLSKKYCRAFRRGVYYMGLDLLNGLAGRKYHDGLREDEFWALKDVNFELRPGECLGVIGHNGAGKSTLLKILSGVIEPTRGEVIVQGRVGSLLEIGAGFHPDLSGRENIYINAAILGMPRKQIDVQFDKIVEFADLGDFLDTPVRFYSSGMYVRLGFAVAAHIEPDVLLVDEVLAVGDRTFNAKCLKHFDRLLKRGCAVVLVSHNLGLIANQCQRTMLLQEGHVIKDGATEKVLDHYRSLERSTFQNPNQPVTENEVVHNDFEISDLQLFNQADKQSSAFQIGDPIRIDVELNLKKPLQEAVLNIGLLDSGGTQITAWRCDHEGGGLLHLNTGRVRIPLNIHALNLLPGNYTLSVRLWHERVLGELLCCLEGRWALQVLGGFTVTGVCYMPHQWGIPEPLSPTSSEIQCP